MNRQRVPYRRVLVPVLLAIVLAVESIAVVAAVGSRPSEPAAAPLSSNAAIGGVDTPSAASLLVGRIAEPEQERLPRRAWTPREEPAADAVVPVRVPTRPATAGINKPKSASKSFASTQVAGGGSSGSSSSPASYKGRNHMWFPALGINRSVSFFACSSTAYPGNVVYRWGCAGKNNVYLFGHAHSVFKPLHDAYVRGSLKKGMKVMYADAKGTVRTYKIAWWKVTTPDNGAFAFAAQSRPSMTLQTCVGSKSQYRLIVRLIQA